MNFPWILYHLFHLFHASSALPRDKVSETKPRIQRRRRYIRYESPFAFPSPRYPLWGGVSAIARPRDFRGRPHPPPRASITRAHPSSAPLHMSTRLQESSVTVKTVHHEGWYRGGSPSQGLELSFLRLTTTRRWGGKKGGWEGLQPDGTLLPSLPQHTWPDKRRHSSFSSRFLRERIS